MKVLFSLFPGREKLLIWLSAAGAAVCAVLGYLFLNPNYRGAYCVSAAVVIILLIFIGAFGLKRKENWPTSESCLDGNRITCSLKKTPCTDTL